MNQKVEFSTYLGEDDTEYEVEASVSPGEPGCWTLANGDPGYPGSGPEVEVERVELLGGFRPGSVYDYNQWLEVVGQPAMTELEARALEVDAEQAGPDDDDGNWRDE